MTEKHDWTSFFTEHLADVPIVVILRGLPAAEAVRTAREAWSAGVGLVEVTVQDDVGLTALDAVVRAAPRGTPVGAGTVTTPQRLATVTATGASFAVAPGLDPDTVRAATEHALPFLPGVATPSEAGHALRLGVSTVKAFPASTLGPGWLRALTGPFPELRVVPTGGIGPDTAPDYLEAGALGIGIGSALTRESLTDLVATVRPG